MSNTNTSQTPWDTDIDFGTETRIVSTPNQSVVVENKPVKILLPDGIQEGVLVQIYKRDFIGQNNKTFSKYMYEVMIGNKIVKGNTYSHYLEQDMKNLGITSVSHLLGKPVRAQITTATIVDPQTKADISFNKIIRLWLTQPVAK